MFFIGVFGINNRSSIKKEVSFECTGCLEDRGEVIESYSAFEIFFIPVYKYNKKYFLRCKKCDSLYWLREERIENILATGRAGYEDVKEVIYQREVCPNCGRDIDEKYGYCPNCGHKL